MLVKLISSFFNFLHSICIVFVYSSTKLDLFFEFLNVGEANGEQVDQDQVTAFEEFGLAELRAATNGFNIELIVSESGERAPNVVYRGKLRNNRVVAIKRFSKQSWPDPQPFVVILLPFRNLGYWVL